MSVREVLRKSPSWQRRRMVAVVQRQEYPPPLPSRHLVALKQVHSASSHCKMWTRVLCPIVMESFLDSFECSHCPMAQLSLVHRYSPASPLQLPHGPLRSRTFVLVTPGHVNPCHVSHANSFCCSEPRLELKWPLSVLFHVLVCRARCALGLSVLACSTSVGLVRLLQRFLEKSLEFYVTPFLKLVEAGWVWFATAYCAGAGDVTRRGGPVASAKSVKCFVVSFSRD